MGAQLSRLVYEIGDKRFREIDHAYHVAMIAESSQQLVAYHKDSLRLQLASAATTLHAQQATNRYLSGIEQSCHEMVEGIDQLNDTVSEGFAAVEEGLERISQQIMQMQRSLERIAQILSRPYETQAKELHDRAYKRLKLGAGTTGPDRIEHWKDATRLLESVIKNPIGMEDYQVWFHIGWLRWKHEKKIPEAEKAFDRARLLSVEDRNLFHVESLHHLAEMQYLQGKFGNAYATIQKALEISREHGILYDAARYAAKAGRQKESLDLLDECINLRPTTILTMFSEADFQ